MGIRFKHFVFIISLTFCSMPLPAQTSIAPQTDKYPKFLSVTANYGWVWKHRKTIEGIPESFPKGVELNFGWQTTGKKEWQQLHNYPRWGLQLLYYYLDDPSQLGHGIYLTPYLDLFALKKPKHELYFKIGTGIAFFTRYYEASTIPENTLISLPVNMSGLFSINYRYISTAHWSFLFGFNFNHSSNGSVRQPNLGINVPSLQMGAHYTFHPERMKSVKKELLEYKKNWIWFTNVSFSTKQSPSEPLNDVNYLAITLSSQVGKRCTRKSMVVAGLDGCYDESLTHTLQGNPAYEANKYPILRAAAVIGYEFILTEKTHVVMQNAFYLYDPYGIDVPIYQRYGFRFMPFKHLYGAYYLKTHLGKADFWEFAIGFKM